MFYAIYQRYVWKPIPGCPGRFILADGIVTFSLEEMVGEGIEVVEDQLGHGKFTCAYRGEYQIGDE